MDQPVGLHLRPAFVLPMLLLFVTACSAPPATGVSPTATVRAVTTTEVAPAPTAGGQPVAGSAPAPTSAPTATAGTPAAARPAPQATASPLAVPAEPPPQASEVAIRFLQLIDAGEYTEAAKIGLQVKWTEVGLQSYQSSGLMSQDEFVRFFDQATGAGGTYILLVSISVDRVESLKVDTLNPIEFPELFALAALPGKPQPLGVYAVYLGGSFDTSESCESLVWSKRLITAELPGAGGWKVVLPGRGTESLNLDPGDWLTNDRPFESTVLLG